MDIENYLTGEERRQMEELMRKAAERRRERTGNPDGEVSGMYFEFRMGVGIKPEENVQQKPDCDEELRNLRRQIYNFCKTHGYDKPQEEQPWWEGVDEELPF